MGTRRAFLLAGAAAGVRAAAPPQAQRNVVREWSFRSSRERSNAFEEVDTEAVFTGPGGEIWRVPAFWAGGRTWRVRFAPPAPGAYHLRTECSDTSEVGLHGQEASFEAEEYRGVNALLRHGPIRVARDGRGFEHADGAPFFFLADDWWLGLTQRLRFPAEFQTLAQDRKAKGFTVIKFTAGLNTDCAEFDPRNANEGGQPWEPGYSRIRPEFFDWADRRIRALVDMGLSPSIVGSWGFYLKSMGVAKMCRHWRYCVARWAAYPVTWYLAMESDLPYYLSPTPQEDTERAQREWTDVGRYLRRVDPFRRPISMQSWKTRHSALGGLKDPALLDFDSLHMGHGDRDAAQRCIQVVRELHARQPRMPVLPGEVVFEGIGWQNWQNIQRYVFWGSMLNGSAGFCYGANGIWQFNRKGDPFGPSPHGITWGGDPWDAAMNYPGSAQVGLGKKLLEEYPFWKIEPHPEWLDPKQPAVESLPPFVAGIPGELRIVYTWLSFVRRLRVRSLEPGTRYRAFWFDPTSGARQLIGSVVPDADGSWLAPSMPGAWDHVLVLDRRA